MNNEHIVKDVFFLNIEDAYAEAIKQNKVIDINGQQRLQYCYYDGPLTDIVLSNFIQVPSDNFVEFFAHNQLPVPQIIAISENGMLHRNAMPVDLIEEIEQCRGRYAIHEYIHADTYYVDPLFALNVAKQKNRVNCGHVTIDGLQVCYYRGELPAHDIENLVHVEFLDIIDYFATSILRLPGKIEIPSELEEEIRDAVKQDFVSALEAVNHKRLDFAQQLIQISKELKPNIVEGEPIRIFIPCSRLTTVMQYSSKGVAKAFEKRGYRVLLYSEANDMESTNMVDLLCKYVDFNPHAVFHINNVNNNYIHDDVINIVWWQDLMPLLKKHQPINWRTNDFNFSFSSFLDTHLAECGAHDVVRQYFVVDDEIFNINNRVDREDKVVFIGSSYLPAVNIGNDEQKRIIDRFVEILNGGGEFEEHNVGEISSGSSLDHNAIFWKIFPYVVRDYTVKWLCANSNIPVEIYGRFWEKTKEVAKHFMGELKHGPDVASVYNSAKYALVSHPFEVNSQRLAEIIACGCIPIVYDCRKIAEKPHWDDYCLFFKSQDELNSILNSRKTPPKDPYELISFFTYNGAVENFITNSNMRKL